VIDERIECQGSHLAHSGDIDHGCADLHSCRIPKLLAGVAVSSGLFRILSRDYSLSHEKGPKASAKTHAWSPIAERQMTQKIIMSLTLLGFLGVLRVFKENTYTSSVIELADDQRVISTGPYAFIRHPMYACALGMLIGIPIAFGSYAVTSSIKRRSRSA
jgi:protein-S-isoprenylcysteine O-methyltransferase Ste14